MRKSVVYPTLRRRRRWGYEDFTSPQTPYFGSNQPRYSYAPVPVLTREFPVEQHNDSRLKERIGFCLANRLIFFGTEVAVHHGACVLGYIVRVPGPVTPQGYSGMDLAWATLGGFNCISPTSSSNTQFLTRAKVARLPSVNSSRNWD